MRNAAIISILLFVASSSHGDEYFVPDARYISQRCETAQLLARGIELAAKLAEPDSDDQAIFRKFSKRDEAAYNVLLNEFDDVIVAYAGYGFPLLLADAEAVLAAGRAATYCRTQPTSAEAYEEWAAELERLMTAAMDNVWCGTCEAIPSSSTRVPLPGGYNSYTLLLVPSGVWRSRKMSDQMESLQEAYFSFAEAIGKREAAVWLQDPKRAGIDILRSKDYCDKFKLSYNRGPYLVFTRQRPDLAIVESPIIIKLSGISPERMIRVFNVLASDLRNHRDPTQGQLLLTELREWLGSAVSRNRDLIKDVALKVLK